MNQQSVCYRPRGLLSGLYRISMVVGRPVGRPSTIGTYIVLSGNVDRTARRASGNALYSWRYYIRLDHQIIPFSNTHFVTCANITLAFWRNPFMGHSSRLVIFQHSGQNRCKTRYRMYTYIYGMIIKMGVASALKSARIRSFFVILLF